MPANHERPLQLYISPRIVYCTCTHIFLQAPAVEDKPPVVLGKTKSGRVTKTKAPQAAKAAKKAAPKKTAAKKAAPKKAAPKKEAKAEA